MVVVDKFVGREKREFSNQSNHFERWKESDRWKHDENCRFLFKMKIETKEKFLIILYSRHLEWNTNEIAVTNAVDNSSLMFRFVAHFK